MELEHKLTHIKMLAQIQLNYLIDLKAENIFTGTLKNFNKNFIAKLFDMEAKYFAKGQDAQEQATDEIYAVADSFYQTIASVPIWEMRNIETIINAYNKDPKSIEGICKKILK